MVRLAELTPEGQIVAALIESPRRYTELKSASKLSDRWLAQKLKKLTSAGVVELRNGKYCLAKPSIVSGDPLMTGYLRTRTSPLGKARLIAEELSQNPQILAIVLFGSVGKGEETAESDIDFLIITKGKVYLNDEVYELMFKYDVPVEARFMDFDELLSNVRAKTTFLLGVLEGYKVLYDRAGVEQILSFLKEQVNEEFAYDKEAGAWLLRSKRPTSTRP